MRKVRIFPVVAVAAALFASRALCGQTPPPQPPGDDDKVITHVVGTPDVVGSFDYIAPTTPKVHVVTTHDTTHYLVPPGTLQEGSYSSETVWVRELDTRDKNWYRASSVPGKRVNAVVRGVYGVVTKGGPGGPGGPGKAPPPPVWTTMSVDLDLDADTNRDGQSNLGEDRLVDAAEDKDEDNVKDNPLGAIAAVGKPSRLLLRRMLPPGLPQGRVTITQERAFDEKDRELPLGEVRITRKADGKEVKTFGPKPDDLWGDVQKENLELLMDGTKEGVVLLTARYQFGDSVGAVAFEDRIRVTVAKIELTMLVGNIDPETGRGAVGAPADVLYEPGDLPVPASNPLPKVKLTKPEVKNIRGGVDSAILADISVKGEVYYPLADIIEGDSANPTKVFVEINGQPLESLNLTVVAEAPSILRPFARKFTYSKTLTGVPLTLNGFSGLVVKCKDPVIGNVGYAGARIEIEPVTSAEPYDYPIGDSLHPVITGGTAQPLKVMVDLSRGDSLEDLAARGARAIQTRAKLSFGGDRTDSVQRGGLVLQPGGEPMIVLADGVSTITLKDTTELTFRDDEIESFRAEVYLPEKWPDAAEIHFVETGPGTSVFQGLLVGAELVLPEEELDPERADKISVTLEAVGYDDKFLVGRWLMTKEDSSSWIFWGDKDKTAGLMIECLVPPSKWSYGFMRMRVIREQEWGAGGMRLDVGQKYVGLGMYDQEHLIQEVPGALDARLKIAEGPWQLRQIVMLQESQPGPYTPFVARLNGPAALLSVITKGTKCSVFDKEHDWSAEYDATWCGGSSKPGVFTFTELPVPGEDFGAGHLDDDANFIFFSVSGQEGYKLIQSKRKDACRVAGKLFEVLRQVAAKRRQDRFDPSKDPGKTYLHLKGPSFSSPKRYKEGAVFSIGNRLANGEGTAFATDGSQILNRIDPFPDYFNRAADEYLDPRFYFGAVVMDFVNTATMEEGVLRKLYPSYSTNYTGLAMDKMGFCCGANPIFPDGPSALYHCAADCGMTARLVAPGTAVCYPIGIDRGLVVRVADYPYSALRTVDRSLFARVFSESKHDAWRNKVGLTPDFFLPVMGGVEGNYDAANLQLWAVLIAVGKLQLTMPLWSSPELEVPDKCASFAVQDLVLNKNLSPGSVHSLGSRYLIGQHTPYSLQGFGATEDPLSNTQNVTQILHFNTGLAFRRYLPHVKEMGNILKEGGWGRNKRLLKYMSDHKLLPVPQQARLDSVAKYPGGESAAACAVSFEHKFEEMLVALKMVQAWEKQTGRTPSPLDFFTAYDIASGECFHLFGVDPFDDIIATQAGYLFRDTLAEAKLPQVGKTMMWNISEVVRLMEQDVRTARTQFRRHESLRHGLVDAKDASGRLGLLRSFLAMQLAHGKVDGQYAFVPVVVEWEVRTEKRDKNGKVVKNIFGRKQRETITRRGRIWEETIGTVVNANIKSGIFAGVDDPKRERIDEAKEKKFLKTVENLLTAKESGYMQAEYDGRDAIISSAAMTKLNDMVEVLMLLDEEPQ